MPRLYSAVVTTGLLLFVAALATLVHRRAGPSELVHFLLPGALLALYLVRREWSVARGSSAARTTLLLGLVGPFLLATAIPIALFLVPYVASGATGALLQGVFVLPTRRFAVATMGLPPLSTMAAVLPLAALAWLARRATRPARWYEAAAIAVLVMVYVLETATYAPLYRATWHAVRGVFPLLAVVGIWTLSRSRTADAELPGLRRMTFLLLATTAMCSLVQYPFAAPSYFTYVAPLVILSALALSRYLGPVPSAIPRAALALLLLFAMFRMNVSLLTRMGASYVPFFGTRPLALERAGIRVTRGEAQIYGALITSLQQRARGGYTWASPDLPEVYFLSGLRNPTRALFEFLDGQHQRAAADIALVERHGITAIVLNRNPYYSAALSPELVTAMERRFPRSEDYGPYQLRWRE